LFISVYTDDADQTTLIIDDANQAPIDHGQKMKVQLLINISEHHELFKYAIFFDRKFGSTYLPKLMSIIRNFETIEHKFRGSFADIRRIIKEWAFGGDYLL
jgi:hypothetical protein